MADSQMHSGHRDRLRRRFHTEGLDSFEKHNVLELLLFFSLPRKDTNELAHRLLQKFGSFSGVLDAPYTSLLEVEGISENSATLLKMIPELARVYLTDRRQERPKLNTPEALGSFFIDYMVGVTKERLCLLLMDSSLRMIRCEILAEGSTETVGVDTRQIVETTLRYNACAVALAHNHPRGFAQPSASDIAATSAIRLALDSVNVRLVDHIIVAEDDYLSMARFGAL